MESKSEEDEIPMFLRKQTDCFDEEELRVVNTRRNLSEQDGKQKHTKVFPSEFAVKPVFKAQ